MARLVPSSPTTLVHGTLSRTSLRHTFLAHTDPPPSRLHLSLAAYWKKLTGGGIQSFNLFVCLFCFVLFVCFFLCFFVCSVCNVCNECVMHVMYVMYGWMDVWISCMDVWMYVCM